jgi:NADPH2 dehydrogenase
MEGWDGAHDGRTTPEVQRRWQRFGESGAKLIWGGEAMAICHEGRANPRQLVISAEHEQDLRELRESLVNSHAKHFSSTSDLVVGFQLTHSGRFCRPNDQRKTEPRIAYRHPILDRRVGVQSDSAIMTDGEVEQLVQKFAAAARVAWNAGADFVDIKHCHGYLLHEFLSARTRPGKYGGSFENRTRILTEIVAAIRADGNPIDIGVRLSAFDLIPYRPDPAQSHPGRPGPGIPEDFTGLLPYQFGFGINAGNPAEVDLAEPIRFLHLCAQLGVKALNLSGGSPYYNPHVLRPAAYPPSDGYQPPHDPLIDVARQIQVARQLKLQAPANTLIVGSAYTYLQEFLPHVAQATVRQGWTDIAGIGRAVLSYPRILADALDQGKLVTRQICRTFSDCTTAPRNGLISGCYPLDPDYTKRPEARQLKDLKRGTTA